MSGSKTQFNIQLTELSRELRSRTEGTAAWRMSIWNFTVWLSYRLKRICDIIVSLVAIVVLSPVLIGIALAVKLTSPGPIIFTQIRVGRYGRHFKF